MNAIEFCFFPLLAWSISIGVWLVHMLRARQRTYNYAARKSEEHGLSPKGSAYSDMATVIVLDGKVDDAGR